MPEQGHAACGVPTVACTKSESLPSGKMVYYSGRISGIEQRSIRNKRRGIMRSLRRRSRIASLLTVGAVSTALVLSGCTVDEDSDQSSEDTTSATTTASHT